MEDEPFSPRWIAAQYGGAAALSRRNDLRTTAATGTDPIGDAMKAFPHLTGPARAKAVAAHLTELMRRSSDAPPEVRAAALEATLQVVRDGAELGRAVYDAMNPKAGHQD